ncbi:hypothetical protein Btru_055846 [Bulinus truncatus]|nr:hypothetical protein Btru_055846 [Bulinus truncatus]
MDDETAKHKLNSGELKLLNPEKLKLGSTAYGNQLTLCRRTARYAQMINESGGKRTTAYLSLKSQVCHTHEKYAVAWILPNYDVHWRSFCAADLRPYSSIEGLGFKQASSNFHWYW